MMIAALRPFSANVCFCMQNYKNNSYPAPFAFVFVPHEANILSFGRQPGEKCPDNGKSARTAVPPP
jgi:hypothetical protein